MHEMGNAVPGAYTINIHLPPNFDQSHRQVLHRYLQGQDLSSGYGWSLLIQAMDMLRRAEIIQGERIETFAAIYDRLVDAKYSDKLIEDLLASPVPYRSIWQVLPGVAQITLHTRQFVVVLYDEWQQRVIARQAKEKNDG